MHFLTRVKFQLDSYSKGRGDHLSRGAELVSDSLSRAQSDEEDVNRK